tara:strand:- start:710 stop:850 length:141 start_codon:yes stop_codon:yes gene_type:complete
MQRNKIIFIFTLIEPATTEDGTEFKNLKEPGQFILEMTENFKTLEG